MKKKRYEPRWKYNPLPTSAYNIRWRRGDSTREVAAALVAAVNEASSRQLFWLSDQLDAMLTIAEPFVDKDILRALIMADGDPSAEMKYGIAAVPGSDMLDTERWYVCPLKAGAAPAIVLVVALEPDLYAEFCKGWTRGFTRLFEMFQDHDTRIEQDRAPLNRELRDDALPLRDMDGAERREVIGAAEVVFGFDTNTGVRSLLYGRDALREITRTGEGREVRGIAFSLDFRSDDLNALIADVRAVKGFADYKGMAS